MPFDVQGQVGLRKVADGSENILRTSKTGGLVINDGHGRYHEHCSRGLTFSAANQASVTTPAGLTASSLNYTLFNPAGSGKLVSLIDITIGVNAAPAAASIIYLVQNNNPVQAAPATVTALIVGCNLLSTASGVAKVYSTATLAAAPTVLSVLGFIPAAATVTGFVIKHDVAGSIILQPGTYVSVQATTAIGLITAMSWEEIDIS